VRLTVTGIIAVGTALPQGVPARAPNWCTPCENVGQSNLSRELDSTILWTPSKAECNISIPERQLEDGLSPGR
jgi:hypothetical protein